jgi:hypothetical protein
MKEISQIRVAGVLKAILLFGEDPVPELNFQTECYSGYDHTSLRGCGTCGSSPGQTYNCYLVRIDHSFNSLPDTIWSSLVGLEP